MSQLLARKPLPKTQLATYIDIAVFEALSQIAHNTKIPKRNLVEEALTDLVEKYRGRQSQ